MCQDRENIRSTQFESVDFNPIRSFAFSANIAKSTENFVFLLFGPDIMKMDGWYEGNKCQNCHIFSFFTQIRFLSVN